MRNISTIVMLLGLLAPGCGGGGDPAPAPPRSRVDVVLADSDAGPDLTAFCEVVAAPGTANRLSWPALDGDIEAAEAGWSWYSLWATWCVPCLAEMPMMRQWETKLTSEGIGVSIRHVSVDATAEDLSTFHRDHAETPAGPRVEDQATVGPWLTSLGLDEGAAIPIHLFVDPQNRVRCIRVGAVSEPDYDTVKHILQMD